MKSSVSFLAVDIGTEAIKALVFHRENKRIIVEDSCLCYFDYFRDPGFDFRRESLRKGIAEAVDVLKSRNKLSNDKIFISLPPDICKGRIVKAVYNRADKDSLINKREAEEICRQVFEDARRKLLENYSRESGILPQDIIFLHQSIDEIKIDGYIVAGLQGFKGENLEMSILSSFLPKVYSNEFSVLFRTLGFKDLEITHEIQDIASLIGSGQDALFVDVGGSLTQIILVKNGKIEGFNELKDGGRTFSLAVSHNLGLNFDESRILKEKYAKEELTEGARSKLKEIFSTYLRAWFEGFTKILEYAQTSLPVDIFIFGGGSNLPEIKVMLSSGSWTRASFAFVPKVGFIPNERLRDIDILVQNFDKQINMRLLLICLEHA